ncbi:hypothetical protein [Mycobacterium lacus]|uniref:Uncharacterized protein n=1 Tax=Mycobacterium lacus TaxID=169765 RepID=A0A7I7NEI5_9MYCO|nr:hypothetical protein [Mycobacterium lacus]MCV7124126.1 hypothetical protein [Mycobacterium lacus]BBX94789.1 hypothetical protein MLAC_00830 [Mycobacterium lacus]
MRASLYQASDRANHLTDEILITAGGFIGQLPRPSPTLIGYRDSPPWSVAELRELFEQQA